MQKKFKVTVDGREYAVTVEDMSEGTSYILPQPGDMKIPVATAPLPAAPPAAASQGPNDLLSPLAGVISAVSVSQGQDVAQGRDVAVIEAMKMKTTIVAHKAGRVSHVAVQVKDAVDTGQLIMTIE